MAKKEKVNVALIIAILALAINIITASIYIYQAAIMREEQHASVWPHVEWKSHYIQDEGFSIIVTNNGIGPALIKSTEMQLDGKIAPTLDSLLALAIGSSSIPHLRGIVENRVLAAGESIDLLKVEDLFLAERLFYSLIHEDQLDYTIQYESIYGQKWISEGYEVKALSDD